MKTNQKKSAVLAVICGLLALFCIFVIIYDAFRPLGSAYGSRTLKNGALILCIAGYAVLTPLTVLFLCRAAADQKRVRKILRIFVVIFCVAGLFCGLYLMAFFVMRLFNIGPGSFRLRTFILCCIGLVYFALATIISVCESIQDEKKKNIIVKTAVIASFVIYVVMFLGFTIFFKNHSFAFRYDKLWLSKALPYLVPFRHTVRRFSTAIAEKSGLYPEILGFAISSFAYVPFAFFLPAIFKGLRRFDSFLPTIVFVIVAVEFFQGMFSFGACKIDDFIFGGFFACLAFYIFRRPAMIKWMNKRHIYF